MTADEIKNIVRCGETSTRQFKETFKVAEDIANEFVAFSNSEGGSIFIGIDDKTGEIKGLDFIQLRNIGQLISAAAESRVHPAVYPDVDTILVDDKAVMVVSVSKGVDAPYTNNKGEVYVKQGPDKRRVTDNNEILRLFADSSNYQPDRQPVSKTSISDIDNKDLDDFFLRSLGKTAEDLGLPLNKALENLNILNDDGRLTLGGLMYFGKNPQKFCPAFIIKAVWFFGNSIGGSDYHDSKDIDGTIPEMFEDGMRFLESCLHRRQAGQNFNSIGILEVSEVALREILQNALVHRSWLKPAPIRLLVFDDRVEIISPGALPNNLTVDDIKLGNAYQRNQLIATLCAKTMDYRGLGSGIIRALQSDDNIEFHNEANGDQFRVILWRSDLNGSEKTTQKTNGEEESVPKSSEKTTQKTEHEEDSTQKTTQKTTQKIEDKEKTTQKIINLMQDNPEISIEEIASLCGITRDGINWQIRKLKQAGKIRRVGPDKGGHWEICE